MRRIAIRPRPIAIVLSSGATLGSLYVFNLWLLRGANHLALVAAAVLVLFAAAILHDTGVKAKAITITVGTVAVLVGLYVLVLWVSLRNWKPEW